MQKRILLAVTGGIAAYKSCELVRLLKKEGHEVTVALSKAASEFVSAQTFEALSGNPVLTENSGSMAHINATRAADLMLIAPASANTIAKLAHGFADNLITEMASARKCALVIAPAMNVEMWQKPANLRNIQQLHKDGIRVLMPASGEQACGEVGVGRMVEPADIVEVLPDVWTPKPLRGKRVLISAGATYEAIDPVRGITNISSGQMGVAIARAMVNRPKLLLADEPTGNLDPSTSVGIMRLLDRINRQGTTVVMATHDDEIVDQMRKRVIELKGGEVVRDQDRGVYGSDR